jgi:uncharacterized NAD(P)/FAD-binding protein YdhS
MKSEQVVPVAIVGGGFSGAILAAQLARREINSVLIERGGRIGRGIAYSTAEPVHVLNVRASNMSAWDDQSDHFAHFVERNGGEPTDFAERRLFGAYLDGIVDELTAGGRAEFISSSVTAAKRDENGWQLTLSDGSTVAARALALATGNQQPETPGPFASAGARFVANPWGIEAREAIEDLVSTGGPVLLLGTGLTMVDVALSLEAAGYRGPITALSRRGLIPRAHVSFTAAPVEGEGLPTGLRAAMRWLRRRGAEVGWRAAVDSLRPHSHRLWQGFTPDEQRRFQRHARPWWDVHRHRIAPQVADVLARMIADGQLAVVAGKVAAVRERPDGLDIDIRRRSATNTQAISVDYAINCTGPLHAINRTKDPVLRGLLSAGAVKPDQLGIGFETDARNRVGDRLWALGALTKGRYWEIIAVPDIRDQAAEVADDIQRELGDER